ncbi:hypothetical protein TrVE_jg11318 [Triparma verrucosa]|uniref:Fe2OG dioxygenase domain-containing protein n=1 Tax=Triparma verrucosa TaxID=1606542 RepID=A0A9W7EUJ7_9STRA|nr:hypothetical protein TrVE_jg11318 [Triparma verrucosa]
MHLPAASIHVFPSFLSSSSCISLLVSCSVLSNWTSSQTSHANFSTKDISLLDHTSLMEQFNSTDVYDKIEEAYKMIPSRSNGRTNARSPLSFLDLFVVKYTAGDFDELNMHRDGSLISFTLPLSEEHEGGGTTFECLQDDGDDHDRVLVHGVNTDWGEVKNGTVHARAGTLVVHSGKMMHGGGKVTKNNRYVLVGFLHVESKDEDMFRLCKRLARFDAPEKRGYSAEDLLP